jgi:ribulose-phosphate 3-epimerase
VLSICQKIHDADMQAGLAFNPDKPVSISEKIFSEIDMILLMSVFAGFGGQSFIAESIQKISDTKKLIQTHNPKILLGVDGGIKVDNIASAVNAGADFIVIGSGLFDAKNYATRIKELREATK